MKTVLIIGANRGLGLEYCRQYKDRGEEVYAACRKASKELRDLDVKIIENVDVSEPQGVKRLATHLGNVKFDIVIHNAGILRRENFPEINFDTVVEQLLVNAVGPLRTVVALKDKFKNPGKLGLMTSRMGSIHDNTSGGYYGYRMSKAALNAAGKSLALDLKGQGIAVALLHPGYVKTDMTNQSGDLTPEESVQGLIRRMDELSLSTTGEFFHSNGERLPW